MTKFKVGDRVRANSKASDRYSITINGWEGVVTQVYDKHFEAGGCIVEYEYFDLVAENEPQQSITMKITNAFKKFLSPDLQAQVKAGFRDEGLNLTSAGQIAALEALLDATPAAQEAFTKAAQEIVAEQEKSA